MRDAYNTLKFSRNGEREKAIEFVRARTADPDRFVAEVPRNDFWGQSVGTRVEAAYAAAALLKERNASDLPKAVKLANHVVKAFNKEGRLYSTLDSVAAIALFAEMIESKTVGGGGQVEVNGVLQTLEQALSSCEAAATVSCVEGVAAVEVERIQEEDWSSFEGKIPMRITLEKFGQAGRSFKLGDQVNLRVSLEDGYKEGDILWLCLPDCLSRIYGGGQVKLFSLDFAGKTQLEVPLAVTGSTTHSDKKGQQKLACCVRNMFEEERGGNPGLLAITATAE
jgi:hypothetical protein